MKNFIILFLYILLGCNKIVQMSNLKIEKDDSIIDLKSLLDEYIELKENEKDINIVKNKIKAFLKKNNPSSPLYEDVLIEIGKYFYRKEGNELSANYGFENIKKYLEKDLSHLSIDIKNESWLHTFYPETKYINALVDLGLSINEENSFGENLLHRACFDNNLELIKFLISKKIEINKKENRLGFTPLFFAIKNFNKEVLDFLLTHNCNVLSLDNEEKTILHHIALNCYLNKEKLNDMNFVNIFKNVFERISEKVDLLEIKDIHGKAFYNYLDNSNLNIFKNEEYKSFHNIFKEIKMNSILDFLIFSNTLNSFIERSLLKKIIQNYEILEKEFILKLRETQIPISILVKYDSILLFKFIFEEKENLILEKINNLISLSLKEQSLEILEFLLSKVANIDFIFQEREATIDLLSLIYSNIKDNNSYFLELLLSKNTDIDNLNQKIKFIYVDPHNYVLNKIMLQDNNLQMFEKVEGRKELDSDFQNSLNHRPLYYSLENKTLEILKKFSKVNSIKEFNNDDNFLGKVLLSYLQTSESNFKTYETLNTLWKIPSISCIDVIHLNKRGICAYNSKTPKYNFKKYGLSNKTLEHVNVPCIDIQSSCTDTELHNSNLDSLPIKKECSSESLFNLIEEDNYEAFKIKLNQKPLLINQEYKNENLLGKAIRENKKDIVKFLLEKGANIFFDKISDGIYENTKKEKAFSINGFKTKYSPLHICINNNNLEFLSILIPYIKEEEKIKVLKYCLNISSPESFKLVFDSVSLGKKNEILNLIFLSLVNKLKLKQIDFLLKNFRDTLDLNYNVLSLAIGKRSLELIEILSESGIKFSIESDKGYPVSYESLTTKNKDLIRKLRDIGAFIIKLKENSLIHYYTNLLMNSEGNSEKFNNLLDKEFIEFLIKELYIDINAQDEKGFTILHLACENKQFKIIKTILSMNIIKNCQLDVNVRDKEGNTPLHLLISSFGKSKEPWPIEKIKEIILIFMDNNLDTEVQNFKNEKFKDILNKSKGRVLVDLLETSKNAELSFSDEE